MKKVDWWLLVVLVLALFIRVYRTGDLLGFYYDQGRDAKVIWDLWHTGKFFLIGPTTGIEGVFRGPWYYWLIAPAYLLGHGNPVWPAIFLTSLCVVAVWWVYKLATQLGGWPAGIIALLISAFSFNLMTDARWLSNPTPMLLVSIAFVQSVLWVEKNKNWGWLGLGLTWGLAMQFGSAAELFYFPVILWLLWQKRRQLPVKMLGGGIAMFGLTWLPQVIFDVRHQGVLREAIYKFLVTDSSFRASFWQTVAARMPFYLDVFLAKIYPFKDNWRQIAVAVAVVSLIVYWRKLTKEVKAILLLFVSPLLGMLFFQGNYGNVYGYYFTGYYLIFVLLFSVALANIWPTKWGKLVIAVLAVIFFLQNFTMTKSYLTVETLRPDTINLGTQKLAIDWIYLNKADRDFNVDVYVPPVIPHAYDYLFLWLGTTKYHQLPTTNLQPLLYTLYEVDPPHPERLEAWLNRQAGIGVVEESQTFGGITVQRRQRIKS